MTSLARQRLDCQHGVREGVCVHASGGPEADLVVRAVVERALAVGLRLHRVGHALVEAALEAASGVDCSLP